MTTSSRLRGYFSQYLHGLILTYFSRSSIDDSLRKADKSKNKNGSPIKLQSKLLAIAADPLNSGAVYVAESAGALRRVILEVGERSVAACPRFLHLKLTSIEQKDW